MAEINLPELVIPEDKIITSSADLGMDLTVNNLPFYPFTFFGDNPENLNIRHVDDRYKFIGNVPLVGPCEPICPLGQYWDCDTEECKEYSGYTYEVVSVELKLQAISEEVSMPYIGDGILQEDNGSYGYFYKLVDKQPIQGDSLRIIPNNLSVPLDVLHATPDFSYNGLRTIGTKSSDSDYVIYGIVDLPDNLLGKVLTTSSAGSVVATCTYKQIGNDFTSANHSLSDCQDNPSSPFPEYCTGNLVSAAKTETTYQINIYGVK